MGLVRRVNKGQMTVELAVGIPVFIAVAFVVCNAMIYLGHCSAFDRLAKDAVRVWAAVPASGQSSTRSSELIAAALKESFPDSSVSVSVAARDAVGGLVTYEATLRFTPTFFGRGGPGSVFGVDLWTLSHSVRITIDPYRPGVFV